MKWRFGIPVALALLAACTNEAFDPAALGNQPPVARIFVSGDSLSAVSYTDARFAWSGTDADGFVVGFDVSITPEGQEPTDWIFTTQDESVATYITDETGTASPVLRVVAIDDRGARSDTASTAFPLVNSQPVLELARDFEAPAASFGAVDLQFQSFDIDGNDTLEDFIEYRYAGSDSTLVFALGDTLADPALGWTRVERPRLGFTLRIRDLPAGDPVTGDQTVFVRLPDRDGAATVYRYDLERPPVRGRVLLIDDDETQTAPRDSFFIAAAEAHFGDAFNVIRAADLQAIDEVLDATLDPFDTILWISQRQPSTDGFERVRLAIQRFLDSDRDPDTPGTQNGQLYFDFQYVGRPSSSGGLNTTFRTNYLRLDDERVFIGRMKSFDEVTDDVGETLDIQAAVPGVDALVYSGSGPATFVDLWDMRTGTSSVPLFEFEEGRWGQSRLCTRTPCQPLVATRWPETGNARVVAMGFPLELADDLGNAQQVVRQIWETQMGLAPTPARETSR